MMSTEFWYMFETSDFCSRFARGTLKREGPAPKAAFVEEPKESGIFGMIVLEGPQPGGEAKPEAELASAGRRNAPEAVPVRIRDRTEVSARIPDSGYMCDVTRLAVTGGVASKFWCEPQPPVRAYRQVADPMAA